MEGCEQYFMAHDEAIKQSKVDIDQLYKLLNGLPNDMKNVMDILKEIKEQINKSDEKYVSKEVVKITMDSLKQEIEKLQRFQIWVYTSLILGAGSFILFLFNLLTK